MYFLTPAIHMKAMLYIPGVFAWPWLSLVESGWPVPRSTSTPQGGIYGGQEYIMCNNTRKDFGRHGSHKHTPLHD